MHARVPRGETGKGIQSGLDSQRSGAGRTSGQAGRIFAAEAGNEIEAKHCAARQTAKLRRHGTKRKRRVGDSNVVPIHAAWVAGGQGGRKLRSPRLLAVASGGMKIETKRNCLRRRKSQRLRAGQGIGHCDQQQHRDRAQASLHSLMSQ